MDLTPRIVVLCGPTRYREDYRRANAELTLRGCIVLSCGVFKGDPEMERAAKGQLDKLHLRKIDLADEVVVIGGEEAAGDSTRREIAYARSMGKPIITWALTASSVETWQDVQANVQEANRLAPGTDRRTVSQDEWDARCELIDSARAYRDALKRAEDLPALQAAYHDALAVFRSLP